MPKYNIVIVGGGFGGIKAALELAKYPSDDIKCTLISDKTHFEYHAALYRAVTGRSPLEVCIPLSEIMAGNDITVIEDKICAVDCTKKIVTGESGSRFPYTHLVLALGS